MEALFDAGGRGAVLSDDGRYRYRLWRDVPQDDEVPGGSVLFIMLNPSTADAGVDDPTIRRCIGFAKSWGYRRLEVGNLFAFRATDPGRLIDSASAGVDVVGPENNAWLPRLALDADLIVCAWGTHLATRLNGRADEVRGMLGKPLAALELTQNGSPKHPLYVPADRRWEPWQ